MIQFALARKYLYVERIREMSNIFDTLSAQRRTLWTLNVTKCWSHGRILEENGFKGDEPCCSSLRKCHPPTREFLLFLLARPPFPARVADTALPANSDRTGGGYSAPNH